MLSNAELKSGGKTLIGGCGCCQSRDLKSQHLQKLLFWQFLIAKKNPILGTSEEILRFKLEQPTRRIIRQCASDVDKERPCYYRAGFGGRANVCDCFESKCNYASTIINSILVTLMCAVSAIIFL
ncbi:hypothetical protein JTE90_003927 [Oedothorax gibbosus]|uniref:Protein sleepless n=1 Tax=Oedothorax gibbosus TaxID=931172 RepID=A0AAV6UW06_9ARAC|nr:hypothetical protein JTE90_003927 [Oedothorax gibbosus]